MVIFEYLFVTYQARSLFDLRALLAIGLIINHGVVLVEVAKRVGVSTAAVSMAPVFVSHVLEGRSPLKTGKVFEGAPSSSLAYLASYHY